MSHAELLEIYKMTALNSAKNTYIIHNLLTVHLNFQVLDPNVEENPLTHLGSKEEEDTDEDESSESENNSDSKESGIEESESDLEDEGNETVSDKLRAAVRDALGFAAPLTDTVTCC
jgi:DNA-directed RNA polymerase specialized sigma54-like protein